MIKDADSEKKARELYEKAYGLDAIKPKFLETRESLKKTTEELQHFQSSVNELKEHYNRGDLDTFFAKMQIPQEKILQWVLDKAQYNELPPEQKRILDAKTEAEKRAYALEKQTMTYEQQLQEQAIQAKSYMLQTDLGRQEVSSFAEAFDAKVGKAGAFREEVIKRGEAAWYSSGGKIDLTPSQAIQEVMGVYGKFLSTGSENPPTSQPPQQMAAPEEKPKQKTIPNLSGRPSSPTKTKVKSIAELQQKYKEMSGQV